MKEIAPRIGIDPNVRFGRAVIKGTRVPVDLVLGKIAGGMTIEEVEKEYELTRTDILAALRYAAKALQRETLMYV
ncbi:MAG: DUF433 domain-containing protein [bacterium]|nr:DUF433 domain-containing protein [bacterium]